MTETGTATVQGPKTGMGTWETATAMEEPENGDGDESEDESDDSSEEEEEEETPSISVTGATLQENQVEIGESSDVDIDLENSGSAYDEIDLEVTAGGEAVAEITEPVSADSEETITETFSIEDTGNYDITVNDTNTGELTVQEPCLESYTFSGTGAAVEQGIDLEGGLTVVDATYTGDSSNFQIYLVNDSELSTRMSTCSMSSPTVTGKSRSASRVRPAGRTSTVSLWWRPDRRRAVQVLW